MSPSGEDKWVLVLSLVREEMHELFRGHSVLGVDEDDMTQMQTIRLWLRDTKPDPPPWRPDFIGYRVRQQARRWLANARKGERGETTRRRKSRWPAVQREWKVRTVKQNKNVADLMDEVKELPRRMRETVECWLANAGNVSGAALDMGMTRWAFEKEFNAAVGYLRGILKEDDACLTT